MGAYEFITRLSRIGRTGFGVLVPNWQLRRRIGLKFKEHSRDSGEQASQFGREQLYEFDWRLAVGDNSLTDEEIDLLVQTKSPLVRLRGQWVAVDPQQLQLGLEFLSREGSGHMTANRILTLASAHPDDGDLPMPVASVEADGWLGDLLAGTIAQQIEAVAPPDSLRADLRPYQQRGLSWLAFLSRVGLGACLADDMGLGKTLQLLALEATERAERGRPTAPGASREETVATDREEGAPGPSLLLCPMSLVGNWQAEARKFTPDLRVHPPWGTTLRGELGEQLKHTDLVVTT